MIVAACVTKVSKIEMAIQRTLFCSGTLIPRQATPSFCCQQVGHSRRVAGEDVLDARRAGAEPTHPGAELLKFSGGGTSALAHSTFSDYQLKRFESI